MLTDDEGIRALNHQWRGLDQATDVLSWPAADFPMAPLGDLAISIETARRQADARGIAFEVELGILAIHGGLHLLGFDDETDDQREEMISRMQEVAADCGWIMDGDWSSSGYSEEDHAGRA